MFFQCLEAVTQNVKVIAKVKFIYNVLTNGENPADVLAEEEMDDDDNENLEHMWHGMASESDSDDY